MYPSSTMKKSILYGLISTTAALSGLTQADDARKPATEQAEVDVASTLEGKLQILDGDKYTPAKVNPEVSYYVVYYTASWWPPCRASVSQLVKSYNEKIAPLKNVELVMMSYDKSSDDALAWAKKESFPWPTVLGEDKAKVHFGSVKILTVPTYILFNKEGTVITKGKEKIFAEIAKMKETK